MRKFHIYVFVLFLLLLQISAKANTGVEDFCEEPYSAEALTCNKRNPISLPFELPPFFPPFGCAGFFMTYESGVGNFGPVDGFGDPAPVGAVGAGTNATGYNSQDGFLYTIRGSDDHVLRLHDDGTIDDLGGVGLPNNIVTGGFDESGNYYVKTGNATEVYIIDVG